MKALLLFFTLIVVNAGESVDLSELQKSLTVGKSLHASFRQTQELREFNEPIITTGEFYFMEPGLIRWETKRPYRAILFINQTRMTTLYPTLGMRETTDLTTNRFADKMIRQIISFVRGDLASLSELFTIDAGKEEPGQFIVTLHPTGLMRVGPMEQVILRFASRQLRSARMEMKDGSVTTIMFYDMVAGKSDVFSAALFVPPPQE